MDIANAYGGGRAISDCGETGASAVRVGAYVCVVVLISLSTMATACVNREVAHVEPSAKPVISRLIDAVRKDDTHTVDAIIAGGVDLNEWSGEGTTALHVAVEFSSARCLPLLLKQGADPNRTSREGLTPLTIAVQKGSLEQAKALLSHGASPFLAVMPTGHLVLSAAVTLNDSPMIQILLENGADPLAMHNGRSSPLSTAITLDRPKVVKQLLAAVPRSRSLDIVESYGGTPLQLALGRGSLDIAVMLIEKGANVEREDSLGRNALTWAVIWDGAEMTKGLLDSGMDVNKTAVGGATLLHAAAEFKSLGSMKVLLEAGADVNRQNNKGNTALHEAAAADWAEGVETLLSYGALKAMRNTDGNLPLDLASADDVRKRLR